jgi:DNA-binding MarR family transcriptional regulator
VQATTPFEHLEIDDVALLTRVLALDLRVSAVLDDRAAAQGLAGSDYLVLGAIRLSPSGRGSPSHIAQMLGRSTGGLTLTIDRLERDGWLRRLPDRADGRRILVELTPAGRRSTLAVNQALHDWEDGLPLDRPARRAVNAALDDLLVAVGHDG